MGQLESLVLGNAEIDKRKRLIAEHKDTHDDPTDVIDNDTKFRKIMQTFNLAEHNHRDPYLGTVEVFRCNHNREFRIYLREILAKSEEELHEDMAQWQRRMLELKHPNLIQLYGCCHQRIENLCGQFYKIFLIFDSVESDLAKQCRDSALNETELWEVIDSVVGSLAFLQERDLPHEAIRSNTIYVCSIASGSKALKVADAQLMGYDSNYLKALTAKNQDQTNMSSVTGYLSPLQYAQLGMRADAPKHDPFKSDVFAFGMLILDLALFEWQGDVYNQADYTINTQLLEDKLNRLSKLVSNQLMEVIVMMLRLSETDRPDLRSLDRHLSSMPSLFDKRAAQNIQLTDLRRIPPLVNKQALEAAARKKELEMNAADKDKTQDNQNDPGSTASLLGLINNHLRNDDSSKPDALAIVKESLAKTNLLAKFMFKQNSQHTNTTNLAMLLQNAEKENGQQIDGQNNQNINSANNNNNNAGGNNQQQSQQPQQNQHQKNLLAKVVKSFAIPVTHHSPLKKNNSNNNNNQSHNQSLSNNNNINNNLPNNASNNNTQNTTSNNMQSNNNNVTVPSQQQQQSQIQGNNNPPGQKPQNVLLPLQNSNNNNKAIEQQQQQQQQDQESQYPYFHIPTEEQEEQKEQGVQHNNNANTDINQFDQRMGQQQLQQQRAPANPKLSDILKTKALELNHLNNEKQQGGEQQLFPQEQQQQEQLQELQQQKQVSQQQQQQQSLKSSMIRKPGDISGNPSRRLTIKDISDMQKTTQHNTNNNTITTPIKQTIRYPNGNIYEGDVLDGKKHGYGVFVFSNGQRYEGYWVNNKRQGKGSQFFSNKSLKYEGMWEADYFSGAGTLYNKEPKPFSPQLPQGLANNNNNFQLQQQQLMLIQMSLYQDLNTAGESWVKYEGEFKEGKKHGLGTIAYLSGNQFIGQFANGAAFGQGNYMFGDGSRFVTGEWANDKLIKEY